MNPQRRSPGAAAGLIPTAAGLIYVQATPAGIARLVRAEPGDFDDDEARPRPDAVPDHARTGPADEHLDRLADQLDAYFDGTLRHFDVPVDWAAAGVAEGFGREVYREIQHVPYGETISYGQVSIDAGRPRNARRVGRLCSLVPVSFLIPVHRVIRADGGLGNCPGYRRGLIDHEQRNLHASGPVAIRSV